jgi:hypothetical protein
MRPKPNKISRQNNNLLALEVGDSLSHYVDKKMRLLAYGAAKFIGIEICARECPTKPGKFEITRTK